MLKGLGSYLRVPGLGRAAHFLAKNELIFTVSKLYNRSLGYVKLSESSNRNRAAIDVKTVANSWLPSG